MHATDLFMLFGVPMLTLVRLDRFHELICLLSPVLTTRNSRPVKEIAGAKEREPCPALEDALPPA